MSSTRSRQGCEECRRRRRKCDEQKPCLCGGGSGRKHKRSLLGQPLRHADRYVVDTVNENGALVHCTKDSTVKARELSNSLPRCLQNGISLPPKYQKLLVYFIDDVLASLSCHPSIQEDLRMGLVPVMLHSPQLMSACLALSAGGFLSRGILEVEGVEILRILGHLQTSGLALLRSALDSGERTETLPATCLIWCLTDVFTYRQGISSWKIHLQGIGALLDGSEAHRDFATSSGSFRPEIDGFLGYSSELLDVLQQIDQLSRSVSGNEAQSISEADILLGKVQGMISRDTTSPRDISICTPLSPEYNREFALCHQTFQQATLIHLYRKLYHHPSGSPSIQAAVRSIEKMVGNMIQGQPCHTWVAMAMPLFTLGCEAFTEKQQVFTMDKIKKLEDCIGSLHVKCIRQALEDIWKVREDLGDREGTLCASQLLAELRYNIILF
ncbi:hypothetical protein V495_06307 [Pseudogymnoascus sp. VKM F-4514 (FW-929)]|nr:hypothetical protein V495_06307 [Pseudogymnoascus sp. VKM F-4514 (FW-929)]KFY56312.1 hypothetical protein V497_06383 [Pseudogymnoascus sp. VKM F-4516 (FW-969)]